MGFSGYGFLKAKTFGMYPLHKGVGMRLMDPTLKTNQRNKSSEYFKEVRSNPSNLTSGEWVAYPIPRTMAIKSSEVRKFSAMQQEISCIIEGILEDYSHRDKYLLGKGWKNLFVSDYSAKVSGFSDIIGQLYLKIVDASTNVRTETDNEIITQINLVLSKPNEDVSLMSNFQVR